MGYFSHKPVIYPQPIPISYRLVFALRNLFGYTGVLVTLRRGGDNVEADFYQGATAGSLNTTPGGGGTDALTWVTQGSGNGAAWIKKWWDQSGNNNHLLQTTAANQYRLISASVYGTLGTNNRPCLYSDGNAQMNLTTTVDISTNDFTCIDVKKNEYANQYSSCLGHSSNGTPYMSYKYSDNNIYLHDGTGYVAAASADGTTAHTYTSTKRSGTLTILKESTVVSGSKTAGANATVLNCLGNRAGEKQATFYGELIFHTGSEIDYTSVLSDVRTYFGT